MPDAGGRHTYSNGFFGQVGFVAGMTSVFIDGEAGTTGLGIQQRLRALPQITLLSIDPARRKDPQARREMMRAVDLVVLCLPDAASIEAVEIIEGLGDAAPKILDASTAFRTDPSWVYGFAEMTRDQPGLIGDAARVANPGCYATGAIALIRPLVAAGLLAADHRLCVNAVSGYSGGGRTMIAAHEAAGGPAFELYALGLAHKHLPEMTLHGGLSRSPLFVPSVGHFPQGMLVSVPLHLDDLPGRPTGADLHAALAAHYRGCAQVVVRDAEPAGTLMADTLADMDLLELRVFANESRRQAVLVARLDNLGKGASGAAVQNIQLMTGLLRPEAIHG